MIAAEMLRKEFEKETCWNATRCPEQFIEWLLSRLIALSEKREPNFWLCSGIAPSGSELYAGTYDPELAKKWAESNFVFPCVRLEEK